MRRDADLVRLVDEALAAELCGGLPALRSYLVADPYGEQTLAAVVEPLVGSIHLVTGPSGTALLYALARRALGHRVVVLGFDGGALARAAADLGVECQRGGLEPELRPRDVVVAVGPVARELVERVGHATSEVGGLLIVDETDAPNADLAAGAATVVACTPAAVVVRDVPALPAAGLGLGLCLGGLAAVEEARSAVPPLFASSLSLAVGRTILASQRR